ncbi:hypothetical protein GCM10022233_87410 [Streptomyces shaanxiensis]|uniref:Cupin type-2 domain-containing protein n=1 Tax=Streptomyces shaanxiensis TaxID=653357 RepID=A0ABP7WJX8_9ACTN
MDQVRIVPGGEGQRLPLPLASLTVKGVSSGESVDHLFGVLHAEAGFAGPGPHAHREHEEFFYILSGEFDFFVGEKTVRVGEGTFISIPAGMPHDFCNPTQQPASLAVFGAPNEIDCYAAVNGDPRPSDSLQLRSGSTIERIADTPSGHWAKAISPPQ